MTRALFPAVKIEPTLGKAALTKAQKQFNTLVKKIEILKQQLLEWRDVVPQHSERLRCEYEPLHKTFITLRAEFVNLLDCAYAEKRMSKLERKKLRQLIPSITAELMAEQPSEAIKALHDKYSDLGYDEETAGVDDAVKSMMKTVLGFDIGDDVDISNPEQMQTFLKQQAETERERIQERLHTSDARRARRKKTPRQIDQEEQKKSEAVQVLKSLQEVFRKLVAALHPDRAPDDAERARRTELMQRVNVAYEKKDLLQLLEMQVQIEQVDRTHISSLSEERLKHYNKILREQSEALNHALVEAQFPFRLQLGLSPFASLSAKTVVAQMERELHTLRSDIAALQHDLRQFLDTAQLKLWLRDYQISKEPEFDELMDMFSMLPFGPK